MRTQRYGDSPASPAGIGPEEIRAGLAHVLSSVFFVNSHRLSRFLRFVVQQAIERPGERLSEQLLGRAVFDRGESFNPAIDTIVRVEANRMRAKLQRYYRTEGRQDAVVIDFRKGSYTPSFRRRKPPVEGRAVRAARPKAPALAVLPFHNLCDDPDQEFLCEGIAEELIHGLSKVDGLRVIAWNSTRRLKGAACDLRSVGAQLKVNAVLEGSVRRIGDHLRIAAQLIDVAACTCLWSEVLESGIGDVLAIRQKISSAIVRALPVERVARDRVRPSSDEPERPELYTRYLKARYHLNRRTEEGLVKAVEYFEALIAEQPGYARAYAGLAEASALRAWYGFAPPRQVMPKARASALKAVKVAPRLSEAHLAAGLVSELYDWDWPKARQSLCLAVDLNEGSATTLCEYGFFLSRMGELDAAFVSMRRALELDPLSPVINTNLGVNYYYQRWYGAAIHQYREALELEPAYRPAYYRMALAHLQRGSPEAAVTCLENAMRLPGAGARLKALLGFALARAGRPVEAGRVRDELLTHAAVGSVSQASLAVLFLGMNEVSTALDWLERAWEEHDVLLVDLCVDPLYDSLREHPRFRGLLARMNFAGAEPLVGSRTDAIAP